eukprot:TRINITY_DN7114_c0_g1_i1.p1 TRINITY_DN7114_c0_g1~~TRINITY_DN7114_c0_g1_i1.p1  ORF type:complete len:908 (-),score=151.52 TRINITY_DN7114_c0_g1_i1:2-2725(-)
MDRIGTIRVISEGKKHLVPLFTKTTGKDVVERMVRNGVRVTGLMFAGCCLDLLDRLTDVGVADSAELEAIFSGGLRLLCKIAAGEQPFEVQILPGETAKQVGTKLKEKFKPGMALCCQLFSDQLPLAPDVALDSLGLRECDRIYPVFLPLQLEADLMGCLKGVQAESAYADSPFWLAPVKQKPTAQSTYLCTLNALRIFWMHDIVGFPQFLHTVSQILGFPPAFLALKHLFDGTAINAEKQALTLGFYHLCRQMLPKTVVPDDDTVFLHFPIVLSFIIHSTAFAEDIPVQLFEDVPLCSSVTNEPLEEVGFVLDPQTKTAVLFEDRRAMLATPMAERKDRFGRLFNDEEVETNVGLSHLLPFFRAKDMDWPFYSVCVAPWSLCTLFNNPPTWTEAQYAANRDVLCKAKHLHFFCFLPASKITRQTGHFLTMNSTSNCIYVKEAFKAGSESYNVFDPLDYAKNSTTVAALLAESKFNALKLPTVDSGFADSRPIQEVLMVLLDDSGSMDSKPFRGCDLSAHSSAVALFGAFADKVVSFRFPFAVGLTSFSDQLTKHLPITRNFDTFLTTLNGVKATGGMTRIWDAVDRAVEALEAYRESEQLFLAKDHVIRILLLSDGGENNSTAVPLDVLRRLQSRSIIVDTVAIRTEKTDKARDLCALSAATGGHAVIVTNQLDGMKIFESEAFIAVQSRAAQPKKPAANPADLAALMDAPFSPPIKRTQPPLLTGPAVRTVTPGGTVTPRALTNRVKRLHQEFVTICHRPVANIDVFTAEADIGFWKIVLTGPVGSSYYGGYWLLYAAFPEKYPLQAPEVRFVTPIFHCNINDDGRICHEVLTTRWSPTTTMSDVLSELTELLTNPNPDDALDSTKATLYKQDKDLYMSKVQAAREQYASKLKAALLREHKLTDV